MTDMTYIGWEDNRGQSGYVYKNKFHDQDYYPKWIDADEMTFRGTLLPKNAVDVSGNGSYYLQYMFKYGAYADNYPNEAKDENGNYYNGFDIGWAVDPGDPRTGAPAGGRLYPRLHRPKPVLRLDRRDLH